jgi:GNAT superfamily N-acetyltransferase
MTLRIERLTGDALQDAVSALARLRIVVFRDWPYLYDGSDQYERSHLAEFAAAEGAVVVAARDGEEIVGAATASPLAAQSTDVTSPFEALGYDLDSVFYFGESVLLPAYRGRGVGHAFFDHREAHAASASACTHTAFCAVSRPPDHPLRPHDYVPLDAFWRKRGYVPVAGLVGTFSWKDVDRPGETEKPMQFWMKELAR